MKKLLVFFDVEEFDYFTWMVLEESYGTFDEDLRIPKRGTLFFNMNLNNTRGGAGIWLVACPDNVNIHAILNTKGCWRLGLWRDYDFNPTIRTRRNWAREEVARTPGHFSPLPFQDLLRCKMVRSIKFNSIFLKTNFSQFLTLFQTFFGFSH